MSEAEPTVETPVVGKPLRKRAWFRLVCCVGVVYVGWCITLYFGQDRLVFPVYAAPKPERQKRLPAEAEVLTIATDEGDVPAWFFPALRQEPDHAAPVVIYCHGNAEIIDGQMHVVAMYGRLGCGVLLPEYRGYGRASGKPSEAAIVADIVRFRDMIAERPEVDASRIVIHGRSLGGGVAAQVAGRREPAALILESTFVSVEAMARGYLAPGFLARHPFRTDRVVSELSIPMLIFHGTRDVIIPVKHGWALKAVAPGATYVEYDCGHNDFPGSESNDYTSRIASFLREAGVIEARDRAGVARVAKPGR